MQDAIDRMQYHRTDDANQVERGAGKVPVADYRQTDHFTPSNEEVRSWRRTADDCKQYAGLNSRVWPHHHALSM
jgi:hypothetical protein